MTTMNERRIVVRNGLAPTPKLDPRKDAPPSWGVAWEDLAAMLTMKVAMAAQCGRPSPVAAMALARLENALGGK